MPSKNTVKRYGADEYYHVYNRGIERRIIFRDERDYIAFLHLLERYLGKKPTYDSQGREYERFSNEIRLVAFCLLPDHFHLLLYQTKPDAITRLMRAVSAAYVRYFNERYRRAGALFHGRYKAARISRAALTHVTRYIHLIPDDYMVWPWSSLRAYLGVMRLGWVYPDLVIRPDQREDYRLSLEKYWDVKNTTDAVAVYLADR